MTEVRAAGQPDGMSLLSLFWTPLVAVGCGLGDRLNAQISVSTFGASIVPDRPRILSVLYKANFTHDLVQEKGSFAISVLAKEQVDVIPKLGLVSGRDGDKLHRLETTVTRDGNPFLRRSLGYLECETIEAFDLGDATCFLAAVVGSARLRDGDPLTWAEARTRLSAEALDRWSRKIAGDIERSRELMAWL